MQEENKKENSDFIKEIAQKIAKDDRIWFPIKKSSRYDTNKKSQSVEGNNDEWTPQLGFTTNDKWASLLRSESGDKWKRLWSGFYKMEASEADTDILLQDSFSIIIKAQDLKLQPANLIPAKREIIDSESSNILNGKGLIKILAEHQNPEDNEEDKKEKFDKINVFLQKVTGKENAKINIPKSEKEIQVKMDNDNASLPLSSLGTGIHEVILIAAYCTLHDKEIICIEEPENHLHPILQRKLIEYLDKNTSNQYFIATHSATFINTSNATLFKVVNDGVQTHISLVKKDSDKRSICNELGYLASDLLQANAIIWVEGPSDRIYIKHWLKAVDPDLKEGIDYSIMFYGGSLLSHLSANDEEVDDFIKLRSLNQNMAIVIDSDKSNSRKHINTHKKRIKEEFEEGDGVCWITEGREIENYIDYKIMQATVKKVHPKKYGKPYSDGQFDHAFYYKNKDGIVVKDAKKVKVARLVCKQDANLEILDLEDRINDLVAMIKKANGISL